jgi:hypothetical protein
MKKLFEITICCLILFCTFNVACAQQKGKTSITSVVKNNNEIAITISAAKPFYVGGNIHILHIGNKVFKRNEQGKINNKGIITFYIPLEDFKAITEGSVIWMSYGSIEIDEDQNIESLCQQLPRTTWYLGKFSKKLLHK